MNAVPDAIAPAIQVQQLSLPGRRRTTDGRTIYAIQGVHGCYGLLVAVLEAVVTDMVRSTKEAQPLLVFGGDYAGHGDDGADVIAALVWLSRHAGCEVRLLCGEQEEALLAFLDDPDQLSAWLRVGGEAALRAYDVAWSADPVDVRNSLADRLPASHLAVLRGLEAELTCGDYRFGPGHGRSRTCVVHGSASGAEPELTPRGIAIDTNAHRTGVLTVLRLDANGASLLRAGGGEAPPEPASDDDVLAEGPMAASMRGALTKLRPDY